MEKETLQKVLDTYTRYLNSLKKKETDFNYNFKAMKKFLNEYCDERLKKHMIQDAYVNMLRSNNSKYSQIKPSSVIALLMKSQDNFDKISEGLEDKELEQAEFQELKEKYFKALDEATTNELTWKQFNKFKKDIVIEINTSMDMNMNVQHRLINVIKMKLERDKFKLL